MIGELAELTVSGLCLGAVYAVIAVGFVLIYRATKVLNFAQGEMVMFGAYAVLAFSAVMPFLAAVFAGIALAFAAAVLIEEVSIRPLLGKSALAMITATLGLAVIIRGIVLIAWGAELQSYPPVLPVEPLMLAGVAVPASYAVAIVVGMAVLAMFMLFYKFTYMGAAMRAVACDARAATAYGISVRKISALAWGLSGALGAVAGVLLGLINGVNAALSFLGLKAFPAALLGGLDSVPEPWSAGSSWGS